MKTAIVLNSPCLDDNIKEENVICADGGYKYLIGKNNNVVALVGDFDSLINIPKNVNVIKLEKEKNYTDGEQAIRTAYKLGYSEVVIYGALGGKIEHILYNINLLKIASSLNMKAVIKENNLEIQLLKNQIIINGNKGDCLSVFPFSDEVVCSCSEGLYYPLINLKLSKGDTRGISNIMTNDIAKLNIVKGEVLIIHYNK